MKIIFQVDGGIGKSVMATAVCKAIKAQYPNDELIVVSAYPEVFLCNPGMKVYSFNDMRYFYEEYIDQKEYQIMAHNPYLETAFIQGKTHLLQIWAEMFGNKYNGELPELFLTNREQTFFTNVFIAQKLFAPQKPIMVIHSNGGGNDQPNKYSWTRDLPLATAQKIVDHFANDYTIVHIRRDDQLQLNNVVPMQAEFRALAVLLQLSEKRLLIDSFSQHVAVALGKPSVVCMLDDLTVTRFGYDVHTNIIANPPTIKPELRHSYLNRFNISGIPTEFPYNHEGEIYDADQIIEAVESTPKEEKHIIAKPITKEDPKTDKNKKKEKNDTV